MHLVYDPTLLLKGIVMVSPSFSELHFYELKPCLLHQNVKLEKAIVMSYTELNPETVRVLLKKWMGTLRR